MRKGEQKPSLHVASRVIKEIRIIFVNKIFTNEARVCREDYYFGPRDIHRDLQSLSSIPLLEWKRNRSRTYRKQIHPYVMLSALQLIS
jgi:hypothetical protein